MCMKCDGYSDEEIERHLDLVIRVHGYLIQQVTAEPAPWTYTIGLRESFDHPELLCVDIEGGTQTTLIKELGDEVARERRIDATMLRELDLALLEVDESHLHRDDLVGGWEERYQRSALRGDFLQVAPGPSWFCECHAGLLRRLDRPAA